jgi:hypothetical protein
MWADTLHDCHRERIMAFRPVVMQVGEMPRANVEAEIKAAAPSTARRLGPSLPVMFSPKTLWTQAAADKAAAFQQVRWEASPTCMVKGRVNGARASDGLSALVRSEDSRARQAAGVGKPHELGFSIPLRA